MKTLRLTLAASMLVPMGARNDLAYGQQADAPINLGNRKQLCWDDALFESRRGIEFQMHPLQRTNERCLTADQPWESWQIGGMLCLLRENELFRMWYGVSHGIRQGEEYAVAYAESRDGVHWTKPDLGLVEYQGSRRNNLVVGYSSVLGQVFVDPRGGPEQRYKMLAAIYPTSPGDPPRYLTVLSSPDGLRWSRPARNVVRSERIALDTQSQVFWDDERGEYVLYTRMAGRQVARTAAATLDEFPEPELVLRPQNPEDADYYQSNVTRYTDAARAWFALVPVFFHPRPTQGLPEQTVTVNYAGNAINAPAPDTIDAHLFTSRDGVTWQRQGAGRPVLGLGAEGSFDSRQIYPGVGYAVMGDEIWVYYTGFDVTHLGVLEGASPFQRRLGTISRARLRLDGFVSASASRAEAELLTRPITFSGVRLELNVDCSAGGYVDCELLTAEGRPIEGYTRAQCQRVFHNGVRQVVSWKGNSNLSQLAGKPVRLKLYLKNADLYAFQFAK